MQNEFCTPYHYHSEFDKLLRVMGQIQFLLFGDQADAPLLHRQGAKKDFDRRSIFVVSNFVNNHGVGGDSPSFYFSLQDCRFGCLFDLAA